MPRDPRYDVLFEPVRIGPVTAKNRFYQVPHCSGMGWLRPRVLAGMRATKAEGGWGVVCTEYCSIHPSSDDLPFPYASLWDDEDTKANALMAEAVKEHGALAGVELWHGGARSTNLFTRETPLDVTSRPNLAGNPYQSRAMDKADIKALRRWHRDAALRAKTAGFDIVYVYATHGYLLSHFLSPVFNTRSDEYGGGLENRARLVREIIEETKEAVGDRCAVAVRFSVEDGGGEDGTPVHGEQRAIFELLAELPDLWDLTMADYSYEMGVSRFVKEGGLEPYVAFAKSMTSKPVVTVGRFTSPDSMLGQVRRGVTDFIGAARPSIADPFLPRKIEEGRFDEIRECIGCNICYAGDGLGVPIRCTQNPTMGEEWRQGWHPETIPPKGSDDSVLIVGAGPAGLEAARALGQRGYPVTLAEAGTVLGGRVTREAVLPGLGEWARVRDYRIQQIQSMANVAVYLESDLGADDILEFGADHIAIATGATWRRDAFGRTHPQGLTTLGPEAQLFTPDDVMEGRVPEGRVLVYDDDGYYMASVLAERLVAAGATVTLVTPNSAAASWASYTAEQDRTIVRLLDLGVEIVTATALAAFDGREAELRCVYGGRGQRRPADALLLVTAQEPRDALYHGLVTRLAKGDDEGPKSVARIGDCAAPAIIAAAVYAGHRYARDLDREDSPVRRDWMFDGGLQAAGASGQPSSSCRVRRATLGKGTTAGRRWRRVARTAVPA